MSELIDTTEMYLKTVYELEEDGVLPLRARIVERLDHSGPTVSQTVARMERDGLMHVAEDRSLQLTDEGRRRATEVIRKHRLAERLLLDVVRLDKRLVHEEACRWEHVMSEQVEDRLVEILAGTATDPFGNPIPGHGQGHPAPGEGELSAARAAREGWDQAVVTRLGEPLQADAQMLELCLEGGVEPGARVAVRAGSSGVRLVLEGDESLVLPADAARHLFLRQVVAK